MDLAFEAEWQKWLWRRAFKKPASPNSQSMLPRRQPRRVQREPRLSRQGTTKCLATSQHRRALRPEADRLTKLLEVLRLHLFSFEIRLDVIASETRLLKRKLCSARERWRRIGIESDVTERKHVHVLRQLQRRFHDEQPTLALLHIEMLDNGVHFDAAGPNDPRRLQTLMLAFVLERDLVFL